MIYEASNSLAIGYVIAVSLLKYPVMQKLNCDVRNREWFDSPSVDTSDNPVRAIYTFHTASAAGMHLCCFRRQLQQSNAAYSAQIYT